jgi:hypothetical protein
MAMNPKLLRPKASGFSPKNISGLYSWWDAANANSVTLNSGNVSEWRDLSGGGRHLSQSTAGNQPAYTTAGRNGRNCLTFSGSSNGSVRLAAAVSSDWEFLHNGTSQYGIYIVASHTGTSGSGSVGGYINTRVLSASTYNTRGFSMWHDFGGLAANNNIRATISASGGLVARRDLSATGGGVVRAYELLGDPANAISASRLSLKNNAGASGSNTNGTTTAEAGSAAGILTVGNNVGGTNFQHLGIICEILIYKRATAIASTESSAILAYLAKKWGL